jgi:hypothetical protein
MEFELEGRTYRANKIDARTQFHIVRRLAPVLGEIAPALQGKGGLDALPPLANAVAKLTDSDADYVIFGLLKAVVRKQDQGLGWGPVATGEQLMYDDITMPLMLKLAWQSFSFNMSGFFAALPSDLKEAAQKQKGQ